MTLPSRTFPSDPGPFVGRDKELGLLKAWSADASSRLMVLHGPSGVGKSALLKRTAAALASGTVDGALWVDLGPAGELEDLESALAESLELSLAGPGSSLEKCSHLLKSRACLLLVDSAEADSGCGAKLAQLGRSAPGLRILAASRRDLDLPGAQRLELKSLDTAPAAVSPATAALNAHLQALGAAPLGVDRAPALAMIAEGLPAALAVLAGAAACGDPEPAKLAGAGLASLPKGLRHALEASLQALPPGGREALRALACLRGGFSASEAGAVAPETAPFLDLFLKRQLLLRPRAGHLAMPRWLRDALTAAGLPAEARARHGRHFAERAKALAGNLRAGRQAAAGDEFSSLRAEMLASLAWAAEAGAAGALKPLCAALGQWLELKGRYQFGTAVFERAAALLPPGEARAWAVVRAAWFSHLVLPGPAGADKLKRAAADLRFREDPEEEGFAALCLSSLAFDQRDSALAHSEAERAAQLFRDAKLPWGEAWATQRLGQLAELEGKSEAAASRYRAAQEAFHAMACMDGEAWCQFRLGSLYEKQGLLTEAEAGLREAVRLFEKLKLTLFAAMALVRQAHVLRARAREAEALAICEHCLSLFKDVRYDEGEAWCRFYLGDVAATQHRDEEAKAFTEGAMGLFRGLRQRDGTAWSLVILTMLAARRGDVPEARRQGQEGEAIFRELGLPEGQAACLRWVGLAEETAARPALAEAAWKKALKLAAASGVGWRVVELAGLLGRSAEARGELELAAELFGLAAFDSHSPPDAKKEAGDGLARLRRKLGADKVAASSRLLLRQGPDAVLKRCSA